MGEMPNKAEARVLAEARDGRLLRRVQSLRWWGDRRYAPIKTCESLYVRNWIELETWTPADLNARASITNAGRKALRRYEALHGVILHA